MVQIASEKRICDGCNVLGSYEHKCHGDEAMVCGEQTYKPCECELCISSGLPVSCFTTRAREQALTKLRVTAEHWFYKGLANDVTPHVMGGLPEPIKEWRQRCRDKKIPDEAINAMIGTAWQAALKRFQSSRGDA